MSLAKERDELRAEVERLRKALRCVLAARPSLTEKGWQVVQEALGEAGKKEKKDEQENTR